MLNNILSTTMKVVTIISQIFLVVIAILSLLMAYILFAPDDLPKPFHLVYDNSSGSAMPAIGKTIVITATPMPTPHKYQPGEGVMLNMSTKIINLVDPAGRKYIRLTVVVEFAPDDPTFSTMATEAKTAYLTEYQNKLNARLPIMDDIVITLLSTKTYEDLYSADGKEKLRQELMASLSKKLPDLEIIAIYFTEFVVQ